MCRHGQPKQSCTPGQIFDYAQRHSFSAWPYTGPSPYNASLQSHPNWTANLRHASGAPDAGIATEPVTCLSTMTCEAKWRQSGIRPGSRGSSGCFSQVYQSWSRFSAVRSLRTSFPHAQSGLRSSRRSGAVLAATAPQSQAVITASLDGPTQIALRLLLLDCGESAGMRGIATCLLPPASISSQPGLSH